jgi:hypothetical protein
MTSNHSLPADPALRRRFLNFHNPKEDKPTKAEIEEFKSFLKPGWNILGILGDFTINYLLENQEVIIDDKNDWRAIAKIVLVEFNKAADLDLPDWINMISDGNQSEDAEVEEEEIIRSFFKKKIIDTFSRHYKILVSWEVQKDESSYCKYKTIESRLNFCLDNQLISFMRRNNTNSSEIRITKDILKELRDVDINSLQHFIDLARLLSAEYKTTKIGGESVRAINVPVTKLINFIDPSE